MNLMNAKNFVNKYKGQSIDVDGAWGAQCVDVFKKFCYEVGKAPFSLGGSGYSDEIVYRFESMKLGEYFTLIDLSTSTLSYGDFIVWKKGSPDCPDSHVGMFVGWEGDKVLCFSQNQFNKIYCNTGALRTQGIIGALRYKNFEKENIKPNLTVSQVANEILYGNNRWGDGDERRVNLEKEGYDYLQVQNIINALLEPVKPKPQPTSIKTGDKVKLLSRTDYNGTLCDEWVMNSLFTVLENINGRVVVTKDGSIIGAWNVSNVRKV